MAIIDLNDLLDDVHYVYNSLKEVVSQVTKKLQLKVDSEAEDPDADNSNLPFTLPYQYYATHYTAFPAKTVTHDYDPYTRGEHKTAFAYQLTLNDNVLTMSGLTAIGMVEGSGWHVLSPEQREASYNQMKSYYEGQTINIISNYPDIATLFSHTSGYFQFFPTGKQYSDIYYKYQTLTGDTVSGGIATAMYSADYTPYIDDSTGYLYNSGSFNQLSAGQTSYIQRQPFEGVFGNLASARAWVNANGATHNYEQTYLVYGGSMTVLYGDNYIIYVVPSGVKVTYNLMKDITQNIATTINTDNPDIPVIKVPTYEENKYGPEPPEPTDDDDDVDEQDMGVGTNLGGLGGYWLLTKAQLEDLHGALDTAPVGFDPLNSFISLMGLGVDVTKVLDATQIQYITPINIRMSDGTTWQTGVEAHIISDSEIVSAFNSDVFRIQRKYNNFLDYSPYATHELFIPMCGWVTLPDIAVDRDIYVTYIPDIESCKCRAVVSVVSNSEDDDGNGCVIAEKDGIMGSDVPFSNVGHSLFVGDAIINGANVAGEAITMAIGAGFTKTGASGKTFRPYEGFTLGGSGTLPGAIGNALVSGNINRTHFMTGNSTKIGFSDGESIIVKSVYHIPDMPDNYAHTVGLVCNKTGQLTEFNGFTVCDNPHITFSALEAEKEEIKRLLEEGVILPSGE